MLLPHIYNDAMGHSLLDDIELTMTTVTGVAAKEGEYYRRIQAAQQDVIDWRIGHALPGHFIDFTPVDGPTMIAVFSGQMHITVSNGEERQLARGDMMFAEDSMGQGHMTRFVGEEACDYLLVRMPGGLK
jgi:hypothetical protein